MFLFYVRSSIFSSPEKLGMDTNGATKASSNGCGNEKE